MYRYRRIFLDLVDRVTQKINTFGTLNDEVYDDDVSICINIMVHFIVEITLCDFLKLCIMVINNVVN